MVGPGVSPPSNFPGLVSAIWPGYHNTATSTSPLLSTLDQSTSTQGQWVTNNIKYSTFLHRQMFVLTVWFYFILPQMTKPVLNLPSVDHLQYQLYIQSPLPIMTNLLVQSIQFTSQSDNPDNDHQQTLKISISPTFPSNMIPCMNKNEIFDSFEYQFRAHRHINKRTQNTCFKWGLHALL